MKAKNGLKRMTMTKGENITFPELRGSHFIGSQSQDCLSVSIESPALKINVAEIITT